MTRLTQALSLPALIARLTLLCTLFATLTGPLPLHTTAATTAPAKSANSNSISTDNIPPRVMREFRAAWIASYANIDWPSKPGLTVPEQKAELIALMDKAVALRLNALILQVRPACDAFYQSTIEPWSEYLTGKSGVAPAPNYDPLKFAVAEAHARGLELHAWFNPYRAGLLSWKNVSPRHVSRAKPKLVRAYGRFLWLDPAEKAVQDYTTSVILDVVRRYDIDGVHLDDYFYPYPENNKDGVPIDFPDQPAWNRYRHSGGKLSRADWRRENVNKLIRRLHTEIKREKKWVAFGVSPFGIWRPGFPQQIRGFDAYEKLYADARYWLVNGWVDYLAPQLYWPIDPPAQSYSALLNWWQSQNTKKIPIYPGGAVTRVGKWPATEIVRQIELTRATPTPGHIHWNISSLVKNTDDLQAKLLEKVYTGPALVPEITPTAKTAAKPTIAVEKTSTLHAFKWQLPGAETPALWILQTKRNNKWDTEILPATTRSIALTSTNLPQAVAISALTRTRKLTPAALWTPGALAIK